MSGKPWDPFKTYDLSPAEQKAQLERSQMRSALKAEWQKKVTNPHRGVHGYIFDPAVQRFMSMRANHWEQFKATPKTAWQGIVLCAGPILLFWYLFDRDKKSLESKCRSGQIAYKDREWKLI